MNGDNAQLEEAIARLTDEHQRCVLEVVEALHFAQGVMAQPEKGEKQQANRGIEQYAD